MCVSSIRRFLPVLLLTFLFPVSAIALDVGYTLDLTVDAEGPGAVDRGRTFPITVTLVNKGPAIAHETAVTLQLPMGVAFARAGSARQCGVPEGETKVICAIGMMDPDTVLPITIMLRTAYQDACSPITYEMNVSVRSVESDAFPENNVSRTWRTAVRCAPPPPACSDGIDNDHDGFVDMDDPGCASPTQDDEYADERGSFPSQSEYRATHRVLPQPASSSASSSSRPMVSSSSSAATAANVMLLLRPDHDTLAPGGSVGVSLIVRNPSDAPVLRLPLSLHFDPSQARVMADDATLQGGVASWVIDLTPRETRVLRFTAQTLPAFAGTSLTLSARAEAGSNLRRSVPLVLSVVTVPPQTGVGAFTAALENGSVFLSPAGRSSSSLLLILAAFGLMSAGIVVAQRVRAK